MKFATVLVSILIARSALGQEQNPDPSALELAPLIITASRTGEADLELPYHVESIVADTLTERTVRSLPEALAQTPGVLVQKTSNGQGSPVIRGLTGYHNLTLIDGIRLNNAAFRSGPNQYTNTIDTQGLGSIELVKSQGSVLYGSDAVGGTLQALTRSPHYDEEVAGISHHGRLFSRYASAEDSFLQRAETSLSDSDRWGLLLGGSLKSFGDIDAAGLGTLPNTGYDEWDIDAKLELFPNPDTKITLFHQQVHLDDAWRVHKTDSAVSWRGTDVGNERARILDQDRSLSYLQVEGAGNVAAFDHYQFSLSHQRQSESRFRERSDGRIDEQGFDLDTYGAWAQFEKAFPSFDLTYGASYYRDDATTYRDDTNADGSFNGSKIQGPFGDDARYHLAGAFANARRNFHDRIDLDLGARATYAKADIGRVEDPNTGEVISINEDWDSLVASARASYRLDAEDRSRLFAGISQSFRTPNFSDLSRLDSARSNEIETPSPDLDPEKFLSFEVGAKMGTENLQATLSYFHTRIDDLIVRTPTGRVIDGENEVTKLNAGDGFVQGVELSASYSISPYWKASLGFAWQDGEVATYPSSDPTAVDEPLDRLLPTTAFLGLRWEAADGRFWADGFLTIADRADRLSSRDLADTQRIPPGGTPGYELLNLRAGWRPTANLSLSAALENIFDEEYRAHGSGQNEPGRGLVLGAEWSF